MRTFSGLSLAFAALLMAVPHSASAKPEALAAAFQDPKPVKKKHGKKKVKEAAAPGPIPEEYKTYFKAK